MLRALVLTITINLLAACTTTLAPMSHPRAFVKNTRFGLYECVWFNAREFCQEITR